MRATHDYNDATKTITIYAIIAIYIYKKVTDNKQLRKFKNISQAFVI